MKGKPEIKDVMDVKPAGYLAEQLSKLGTQILILRAQRDANYASMMLMQQLLCIVIPERAGGCWCDDCLREEIAVRTAAEAAGGE